MAVWGGVVLPVPPGISSAVDLLAFCFVFKFQQLQC